MSSGSTPAPPPGTAPGPKPCLIDNLERYLTIEEILGIPPASDRFEGRRYDGVADVEAIDGRADELRHAWDIGLDPVPSLCTLLEGNKGIKVIEDDLPERINGLACQVLRGRQAGRRRRPRIEPDQRRAEDDPRWPTNSRTG